MSESQDTQDECIGCHSRESTDDSDYCSECRSNLVADGYPWGHS